MSTKKSILISLLLAFGLSICGLFNFATVSQNQITTLTINTEHTVTASTEPYAFDAIDNRFTKFYFKNFAPYISVYRFKVTAGENYTLKTVFKGDKSYSNIELLGENPFSKSVATLSYSGATARILSYTGSFDTLSTGYTQKSNLSIDSESTGSYLYMIGHFASSEGSLKVTLTTPAELDKSITASQTNAGGTVYALPMKLTKMPDETEQLKLKIDSTDALVNGAIEQLDISPIIKDGNTMVPLRFIGETLGATIEWDPTEKKITSTLGTKVITLWIGKDIALVDGKEEKLTVAPYIRHNRTLVPLRFVAEKFGASLQWFEKTQEIIMTY